jgi:glyoxylase I family protein
LHEENAMLKSFEHVGMTVGDLDRSLNFYANLLGLKPVLRKPGKDGAELAFLDAGGGMLEMAAPAGGVERAVDVPSGRAGLRHLTFRFENVDEIFARLEAAGVEMIERPRPAANSEVLRRVAFCRDPDGIIVELAEK